jgi:ribosome-dependent ATPase
VTIFVTTHFMNEGMRCDRISLMNAGKVLACDAPQKLIEARKASSLEEAFIGHMEDAIAAESKAKPAEAAPSTSPASKPSTSPAGTPATPSAPPAPLAAPPKPQPRWLSLGARWFSLSRMFAYTYNEAMQIWRDPVRLAFAFVGSALLMLTIGFGVSFDVEHVRYAAYDLDRSPESRYYLAQFSGAPRYFTEAAPIHSPEEELKRLKSDDISLVMEIPPNFGRDLRKGSRPDVLANVDGADTFRGRTVAQYVQGVAMTITTDPGSGIFLALPKYTPNFQQRYMYNPAFESIYAIVPSVMALVLILIPAILMAVSIVREKELGSIINFYVTPSRRLEYLLGKQLPYVVISMVNYFILVGVAMTVFGLPIKGSFLMLTFCTLLYVIVTTGIGMVISAFTASQVAAVIVTAIVTVIPSVQFSGMLVPVSTLAGQARVIGMIWPATYYMHSSLGAFTKGLGPGLMLNDVLFLACCIPILWAASALGMRKQEK